MDMQRDRDHIRHLVTGLTARSQQVQLRATRLSAHSAELAARLAAAEHALAATLRQLARHQPVRRDALLTVSQQAEQFAARADKTARSGRDRPQPS